MLLAFLAAVSQLTIPSTYATGAPYFSQQDTTIVSTPQDIIRAVIESNLSVESLRTAALASEERTGYVGALPDPTIMVTAQPFPVYTARGKQVAGIRVEQSIPFPGKRTLLREVAVLEASMGVERARTYAVESILEAQLALNEIRRLQSLQGFIAQFQSRLDQYESLAIQKYEVGDGNQQAVLKIQLERSRLDQTLLELDRQIEGNTRAMARIIQHPVRIGTLESSGEQAPRGDLDLESRSDVQMLARSRDMADARKEMLRYYNKPDVGVSLNWIGIVESDMPASSDGRDALALGVAIRLPLGRGAQRAREQESDLQIQAASEKLESTKMAIGAMFREVGEKMDLDKRSLEHLDASLLPGVEALMETSVSLYSTGRGDFMDLLDAERTRFQLEKDRIDIVARIGAEELMLDRISGRLNRLVAQQF